MKFSPEVNLEVFLHRIGDEFIDELVANLFCLDK